MAERSQRRWSLSRSFSKFKDAIKRRRSTADAPLQLTTEQPAQSAPEAPPTTEAVAAQPTMPAQDAPNTSIDKSKAEVATPLVIDDGGNIEVGDNSDETVEPIATLPTGFSAERVRAVFDKYNIKYNEPTASTTERKRVERPIRIRIHWTCHECQTSFGRLKTCTKCGHRRCEECPRSPAKRVKQILEGTSQLKEIEQQIEAPPSTDINEAVISPTSAKKLDTPTVEKLEQIGEDGKPEVVDDVSPEAALEPDPLVVAEGEMDIADYQYVFQYRPNEGKELVLRPKSQIVKRTCHKCHTVFEKSIRIECQNCGHIRCRQCPREPAIGPQEGPQMVATVQRVYKKPRQRVRWTCDQCQTMFVERLRCRSCGHERCKSCIRTPYVKHRLLWTRSLLTIF